MNCAHCTRVIGWGGPLCKCCGKRIHDGCRKFECKLPLEELPSC